MLRGILPYCIDDLYLLGGLQNHVHTYKVYGEQGKSSHISIVVVEFKAQGVVVYRRELQMPILCAIPYQPILRSLRMPYSSSSTARFHVRLLGILANNCHDLDWSTLCPTLSFGSWLSAQYLKRSILHNPTNGRKVGRFFQIDVTLPRCGSAF